MPGHYYLNNHILVINQDNFSPFYTGIVEFSILKNFSVSNYLINVQIGFQNNINTHF